MRHLAFQVTNIQEKELFARQMAAKALGVDVVWFGLIPFSDEMTGMEGFPSTPTPIFGATKLVKMWDRRVLPSNAVVFYDKKGFDQAEYSNVLGDMMLNKGAKVMRLGDIADRQLSEAMFIKPTSDLKAFAGMIVEQGRIPREEIWSHHYS